MKQIKKDEKRLLMFLKVVDKKEDVQSLLDQGMQYSEIAQIMIEAKKLGLTFEKDERMVLSEDAKIMIWGKNYNIKQLIKPLKTYLDAFDYETQIKILEYLRKVIKK
jgi:hypothetical protein